MTDYL